MTASSGNSVGTRVRTFEDWMQAVDVEVQRRVGVSRDDLPDYCYRDAYDDGTSPSQAARDAIRAAKDEFG